MIIDANGMPVLQPLVDDSSTATFNAAFAQVGTVVGPLTAGFAQRQIRTFKWANAAARTAQTGMSEGDVGHQIDTRVTYLYTSSAWKAWSSSWTLYTPTAMGLTVGTGGSAAYNYRFVEGDVEFKTLIRLGTGGTWSLPSHTLPVTPASEVIQFAKLGTGSLTGPSGFWDVTVNYVDPATGVRMYGLGGTPSTFSVITATSPVAVASGVSIFTRGMYTPA